MQEQASAPGWRQRRVREHGAALRRRTLRRDTAETCIGNLASRCKRVQNHEGDLDSHRKADRLGGLLDSAQPTPPEPVNDSDTAVFRYQ